MYCDKLYTACPYLVPQELEQAADAVANDGRAEVPDVHFLGDVGRREVHEDPLPVQGKAPRPMLITLAHTHMSPSKSFTQWNARA
jgi:hypothetical protein